MDSQNQVTETVVRLIAEALPDGAGLSAQAPLRERGLTSLAAVRVWFDIQRAFGVQLPAEQLGECSTAADIAARVAGALAGRAGVGGTDQGGSATPVVAARPDDAFEPFPLTPIQQAYVLGKDPDLTADPARCQI
ncbi:MAG TPA: phosphopantetheine-binding protein, partial [Micromonosporaceae bacterium]|nr:phosphopantetheine-binding protein [Micromonosporaceae bacterium]